MDLSLSLSTEQLKSKFNSLKIPEDIADLLEVDYKSLNFYLYRLTPKQKYSTFQIPKKSGGTRTISAPIDGLKILQYKLRQVLETVYQPKPSVHGFVKERSIVTNAESHMARRRRYVLNVDIKDFFPSINFGRVRGLFIASPYNLPPPVATVLAQICCLDNRDKVNPIPQGAPTSPIISNMICARMDSALQRLAQSNRCTYTRYADDITFSTSTASFPTTLAEIIPLPTGYHLKLGDDLETVLKQNGFSVNLDKVRLQVEGRRQEITGLVVNKMPNVPREHIRQIRAMLYAWSEFGYKAAEQEYFDKYHMHIRLSDKPKLRYKDIVRGKIEYIGMVKGKYDPVYVKYLEKYKHQILRDAGKTINSNSVASESRISIESSPRVFISYAREDANFVSDLIIELKKRNVIAWVDTEYVDGGARWRKEIDTALDECQVMLLVLSPDSMSSEEVELEWNFYIMNKKPLIPLLYKPTKLNYALQSRNYIDFSMSDLENSYSQLWRSLERKGIEVKKTL